MTKTAVILFAGCAAVIVLLCACSGQRAQTGPESSNQVRDAGTNILTVGVTPTRRRSLARSLTLSSELVPFQEIDVYAKESGFVKQLFVDYGTRVRAGQVMAVLEIPELEAQIQQDQAAISAQQDEINRAAHDVERIKAQHDVAHLQYTRLAGVAKGQPGLVAQQEVDDAQGKDLAAESQMEAAQGSLDAARGQSAVFQAKLVHDQAIFSYSKIPAPFNGVITQRYANLGALMQGGTNSSTQAMPLVRLSQDDLFRLVIPVPESYAPHIRIGEPVNVRVPSLNRTFPGKVIRTSVDVQRDTRTMHTEVDVANPNRVLIPGLYAEATLTVATDGEALTVPLSAVDRNGDAATVDVVLPDNRIEVKPVKIGVQDTSDIEILSGLKDGENVVISDRSGVKAGQEVQPKVIAPPEYSDRERHP